jgi:glutamyl-tRNA reductase
MSFPLAIVGASFRDVPTKMRARLHQLDEGESSPSAQLREGGHVQGVVRIVTCSRVEWVMSTATPEWAASMLMSALAVRVPEVPLSLHSKHGLPAANYLFRVVLGLDSVAEGESAVGRQVLTGFANAHKKSSTDPVLRQVWKQTETLIHQRRAEGAAVATAGIQSLVVAVLLEVAKPEAPIVIWGLGEVGRATQRALARAGFTRVVGCKRGDGDELQRLAKAGAHVVVCTGATAAYLELPAITSSRLCIDIGCPAQVVSAPGWERMDLDALLSGQRQQLDDSQRSRLIALAKQASDDLQQALADNTRPGRLSSLEETRRKYFSETLPALLEDLPRPKAEKLRQSIARFAHQMLSAAGAARK